jgi:hypothetical protein
MGNLKKIIRLTFYLSVCILSFSESEGKAQVKEMSAQDLTTASTAVFYGRCSKKSCDWDKNHRIIYTYVSVTPEAYIKGNLGSQPVIAVPGGQVGDVIYEVSDMPEFAVGEETIAFVWTNSAGNNLVTGGFQGRMKIEKDKKTGKRMVEVTGIMDNTEAQKKVPPGQVKKAEKMQLEEFVTKVKTYMKN